MKRHLLLATGLSVVVLLGIGAAAQIGRNEFQALVARVANLEARVQRLETITKAPPKRLTFEQIKNQIPGHYQVTSKDGPGATLGLTADGRIESKEFPKGGTWDVSNRSLLLRFAEGPVIVFSKVLTPDLFAGRLGPEHLQLIRQGKAK